MVTPLASVDPVTPHSTLAPPSSAQRRSRSSTRWRFRTSRSQTHRPTLMVATRLPSSVQLTASACQLSMGYRSTNSSVSTTLQLQSIDRNDFTVTHRSNCGRPLLIVASSGTLQCVQIHDRLLRRAECRRPSRLQNRSPPLSMAVSASTTFRERPAIGSGSKTGRLFRQAASLGSLRQPTLHEPKRPSLQLVLMRRVALSQSNSRSRPGIECSPEACWSAKQRRPAFEHIFDNSIKQARSPHLSCCSRCTRCTTGPKHNRSSKLISRCLRESSARKSSEILRR